MPGALDACDLSDLSDLSDLTDQPGQLDHGHVIRASGRRGRECGRGTVQTREFVTSLSYLIPMIRSPFKGVTRGIRTANAVEAKGTAKAAFLAVQCGRPNSH